MATVERSILRIDRPEVQQPVVRDARAGKMAPARFDGGAAL
jgi:hypothetical protein